MTSEPSIQADLFGPPSKAPAGVPPGLRYWPDVLSYVDQAALGARLETLAFKPYEFRGYVGNRRVVYFGHRYDQASRTVEQAEPIPDFLLTLRDHVAVAVDLPAEPFVHVLVNEYAPGAGIGWHRDRRAWDQVLGVSLLAPCRLRLRRRSGDGWERASIPLAPGSAYLLSGEAREDWEHSILPATALRYSITFRTLAMPG